MVATTTTTTIAAVYSPICPHSILSPTTSPALPYPSRPTSSSFPSLLSLSNKIPLPLSKKPNPPLIPFCAQILTNPLPLPPLSPQNHATNGPPTQNYFNFLRTSVHYKDVELAKAVHASTLKREVRNITLSSALVSAYLKLGLIDDAHRVISQWPDVVLYSTMMSGLAKSGFELEAVGLFFRMRETGIEPNGFTFVAILTACSRLSDLELGFQVHSLVVKMGYLGLNTYVANALMGLYSQCGYLEFVLNLFDEMPERDVASWNTVISAVLKESMYDRAIELFRDMQRVDGFRADRFTLSTVVVACTGGRNRNGGRQVHAHGIRTVFQPSLSVNNALIGLYTKCGCVRDVETLFELMPAKDIITWTEMITAYMDFGLVDLASETFDRMPEKNCVSYNAFLAGCCQNGKGTRALVLFCKMVEEGIEVDECTLTSVINACGLSTEMKISEQVHGFALKCGFGSNDCIESALVDMCMRCGRVADAEKMFYQGLDSANSPINWTSMISGYSRNGKLEEAISLFCTRQSEDVVVDEIALTAVLGVCGTLGYHVFGKQIHCLALKLGLLNNIRMDNALTNMYYKCGNLEGGIKIFGMMSMRDTVSWNNLMGGHLLHKQGDEALDLWSRMKQAGTQPDEYTLRLVISAYGYTNSNLVDKCRILFLSMKTTYTIEPTLEHYASFVGVLGYWDLLEEAEQLINNMPFEPNSTFWRALLNAGRICLNTRIGTLAAKQILSLEPLDPSTYVLVANLYSASGRWQCAEKTREEMRKKGFRKLPSRSWIIHQNKVHSFYTRDERHCQSRDIYGAIEILLLECMKSGYVPDTSFVLQDVEEYQKKDFLYYHSAKLAATYGLLTTRRGEPIIVMKNVALCRDCHTFLKFVSVVARKVIIFRDSSGFHVFSNGQCSCKDYW